jgi:hypothetical protein
MFKNRYIFLSKIIPAEASLQALSNDDDQDLLESETHILDK